MTGQGKQVVFQVVKGDTEKLLNCNTAVDFQLVPLTTASVKMIKDSTDLYEICDKAFNGIGK